MLAQMFNMEEHIVIFPEGFGDESNSIAPNAGIV